MSDQNPYQPGESRSSSPGLIWQFPAAFVCLALSLLLAGRTGLLLTEAWGDTANAANAPPPAGVAGGIAESMKYAVFCAPLLVTGLVCLWIGFRKSAKRRQPTNDELHYRS